MNNQLSYNLRKTEDIKMGIELEEKFLKFLQEQDKKWFKTKDKYNIVDFVNEDKKIIGELKSRKYICGHCEDWMIGVNKIQRAKELHKKGYKVGFYFAFYDGIWKWRYSPKNVRIDTTIRDGGRVDRNINEIKKYYYIPNNKMKFITDKIKVPKIDPFPECVL